jgi:cellulose synthase/poly-beta-1,6-N-acetylglucosamine synthase-like glycosyltransferase
MTDPTPPNLQISVVIPTYKRADLLELLLDSLLEQTVPMEMFEVIVVDNVPEGDAQVARLCESGKYAPVDPHLRAPSHPGHQRGQE